MHFDKRLAVFSAIFICASASQFLEQEWTMWKSKYGKSYTTKTVESFRKTAWEATWEKVEKHNQLAAQGLKNYTLEMNHFADKTPEERKSHSCFRSSWKFKPPGPSKIYSRKPAQATNNVDWRKTKCVTHIKNQGGLCGSCWAFAAVGVLESRYCLKKGKRVVLSEQQLVDCDSSNDGCCGGFPIAAFVYITQNGIMRNKHYEYLEKNSECKFDEDKAIILNVTKYYSLPDEENMASDVAINGPITVGIGASDDLTLYKEGIYDGDCEELNHAIIIVGYGSEPSKDDPENTEDYWIIRNRMHFDKHLLIFSMIIICTSAAHFLEQEWNIWKFKYEKTYETKEDEMFRRKAWEATWDKVQTHNQMAAQGLKRYTLEMNRFADMTSEERNSHNCLGTKGRFQSADVPQVRYKKPANIPAEVDWRKSKCVTPAKDQGSYCGSCWAFATVGVIETHYCLEKGEQAILSEQQLVDCDAQNEGCCGGLPIMALAYLSQHGIMRNKDYEYSQKKFKCLYKDDNAVRLNVTKYYTLPGEDNIASTVAYNGPVTVGIGITDEFMLYKEGIYDGDCASQPNHAVIIVGYGTEPRKEEEEEDNDYWIIKNSWGTVWGENGFGKIKRNVNKCNIADMVATMDFSFA
uniref:Uncharacterized protein n=1 Tax=Leptobrachium leishanense TaxID=445787 RepID=A0A8C5QQS2_9ANUR